MSRSSTSSSEGKPRLAHPVHSFSTLKLNVRPLLKMGAALLFVFVLLEIALRIWPPFELYDGWEHPDLYKKVKGAEIAYKRQGRLDVLVLATSIGRPVDVNRWEDATGNQIVCYNGGYPDARPQSQRFLFEKYYYPQFKPTHLAYFVSPGDLSSSARGKIPDKPRLEPFWRYRKIRQLEPSGMKERGKLLLEDMSMLFRSRERIRATMEQGPLPAEFITPSAENGVIVPSIRRIPTGPQIESWARRPEWLWANPYHKFWLPKDGEMGELHALADFCKANGVVFTIVDTPVSPFTMTNFDDEERGMGIYRNALKELEDRGVPILRAADALKLDNSHFEDADHMNRWGAELVTDYTWQHLLRPWFPGKALVETLPQTHQVDLCDTVTSGPTLSLERRFGNSWSAVYVAPQQVVIQGGMATIPVKEFEAGRYSVEVYAGDGHTTTPEMTGAAKITLQAISGSEVTKELPLDAWALSRLGISYTQALITIDSTATLQLHVDPPPREPVIFDVAFTRRMVSNGPDRVTVEEGIPDEWR